MRAMKPRGEKGTVKFSLAETNGTVVQLFGSRGTLTLIEVFISVVSKRFLGNF